MPGPARTYATNAARQRAYRERCQYHTTRASQAPGPPNRAPTAPIARWRMLVTQARAQLHTVTAEMQAYYEQHSERWRDGEQGESFLEQLEALYEAHEALPELEL